MSLLGRLICWATGEHDRKWEPALRADGTERENVEVDWCPRCTRIWNVREDGEVLE